MRGDDKWRSNHSTLAELTEAAKEVVDDQPAGGPVLELTESEARCRSPQLVIAYLGVNRQGLTAN